MCLSCSEDGGVVLGTWFLKKLFSPYSCVIIIWTGVTGIITLWVSRDVFLNERNVRCRCPWRGSKSKIVWKSNSFSHIKQDVHCQGFLDKQLGKGRGSGVGRWANSHRVIRDGLLALLEATPFSSNISYWFNILGCLEFGEKMVFPPVVMLDCPWKPHMCPDGFRMSPVC